MAAFLSRKAASHDGLFPIGLKPPLKSCSMELSNQESANSEDRRGKPRTVIEFFKPDYITKSGLFIATVAASRPIRKGFVWAIRGSETKRDEKPRRNPRRQLKRNGKRRGRKRSSYSIERTNSQQHSASRADLSSCECEIRTSASHDQTSTSST